MNGSLRYAFFGSGVFAAECLELLSKWRVPSWIVTAPPAASGRGNIVSRTPVGKIASSLNGLREIHVLETASASSDDAVLEMKRKLPVDFSFVIDFGHLIREPLLAWEEHIGCLNIHPSELPLYRGAATIQRALMDGARVIGVSIFKLAAMMDAGPVLFTERIEVDAGDDFGSLRKKAAEIGTGAFIRFALNNPPYSWTFKTQDESGATYARKISSAEERIDWRRPARSIVGLVRALSPKPGAWTTLRGKRLLVLSAREASSAEEHETCRPGELRLERANSLVGTGEGLVEIVTIQPEGRKPQPASAWKNGLRASPGECMI